MKNRGESESMNFSSTHQCLICWELIATHAEPVSFFKIEGVFWSKDVIIPVLAIALPSTCKSLVHQNGKVIRATAEVDNLFSLQKHKC
jgi:hypothetical protein